MKIENARIRSADVQMSDHGIVIVALGLEGYGWGAGYTVRADIAAMEALMRIGGVSSIGSLKGQPVRAVFKGMTLLGIAHLFEPITHGDLGSPGDLAALGC
jgi:hypothetical protein